MSTRRVFTRILLILIVVFTTVFFAGCEEDTKSNNWYVLPDLNGQVESDIIIMLDDIGVNYMIEYYEEGIQGYNFQFIMYENHDIGEVVNEDDRVTVIVYPEYVVEVVLPDLMGLEREDIVSIFVESQISYYFVEETTTDSALDNDFIEYVDNIQAGDVFNTVSAIGVVIYNYVPEITEEYFQVIDMVYDGPYLDESYASIDYLDPRGGYFEVTLLNCTDGDTGRFNYPQDVYDAIVSNAKSTRFLNMDTEETYTGGEEEWGKPGSVYTCSLLESAESIILQTDPGDGLTGTYGRLLAWVWIQLPGEDEYFLLNYMVVKQGLAQVKFEFGAGLDLSYGEHTYNEWMHIAEDYAIANELGQWGTDLDYYWNYELDQPYYDRWYE